MTLDEEILAEGRLGENQELMLYNMSLRQTSQRAAGGREGTHMPLSKIEGNRTYEEMIERGLLERRLYGQSTNTALAAATLVVTNKGLRYCVLFASEIEPKRAYDIAGVQRQHDQDESQSAEPDEFNYAIITSGAASGSSPAKSAAVALSEEQVKQFEELGAQRRASNVRQRESRKSFSASLQRREYISESGDAWTYVQTDEPTAQIVGVIGASAILQIPSQIMGVPVVSIAADALSENDYVKEIICPDGIESIGERAFRLNPKLKKLALPAHVDEFRPSWISRCPNLEELVLPGLAEEITRGAFESKRLRKLVIGRGARTVRPGAFQDTNLAEVVIDQDNPYIFTDGTAIYSKDGTECIALARPVSSLAIAQGCVKLAKKSCCGFAQLKEVSLPQTLAEIGPFAFSHTGIERFDAPSSLRTIGDKAFLSCTALERVTLNKGLETVGDSAFEGSAITELAIPASIRWLGKSMTKGTSVVYSGPECTLTIEEGCADLLLDGAGGLYRKHEDGLHLVQLVDGELQKYSVLDGAVAIGEYAFAYHDNIRTVRVAQTVRTIERSAFRACRSLQRVELPDTVESIGDEAFLDTNLEAFRVPAACTKLGERALVTYGAHHGSKMPSLAHIEVAPGNESFYVACGMLCRKTSLGASVIAFTSSEPRVVFPEEITHVEEYAFSNARGIEYLGLNSRLSTIGTSGLSTQCWIRHIHVETKKPIEGRTTFDFFFPDTPGAVRGIALGLGGASWVNVPGIMEQLDLSLVNARDYNVPGKSDNINAYTQAKLILDRFDDPIMLTSYNRTMMERVLRSNIEDICVDVALHDDRSVLEDLIDRGFVNADNLEGVIERVNKLKDAASTAYLLEAKREKFSGTAFDYDL